eukprot:360799-Chlamydomonas_euryale.AAC.4
MADDMKPDDVPSESEDGSGAEDPGYAQDADFDDWADDNGGGGGGDRGGDGGGGDDGDAAASLFQPSEVLSSATAAMDYDAAKFGFDLRKFAAQVRAGRKAGCCGIVTEGGKPQVHAFMLGMMPWCMAAPMHGA